MGIEFTNMKTLSLFDVSFTNISGPAIKGSQSSFSLQMCSFSNRNFQTKKIPASAHNSDHIRWVTLEDMISTLILFTNFSDTNYGGVVGKGGAIAIYGGSV